MHTFSPNTKLESAKVNQNFTGLADGSEINDDAITPSKWTNPYICRAYLSSNQLDLSSGVGTKVNLNAESYDINSNYDTGNYRYTAPVTGYYQVNANIRYVNSIADKIYQISIFVNGSPYSTNLFCNGSDTNAINGVFLSDIVYAVAGQYIELYTAVTVGVNTVDIQSGNTNTYMSIALVHQV